MQDVSKILSCGALLLLLTSTSLGGEIAFTIATSWKGNPVDKYSYTGDPDDRGPGRNGPIPYGTYLGVHVDNAFADGTISKAGSFVVTITATFTPGFTGELPPTGVLSIGGGYMRLAGHNEGISPGSSFAARASIKGVPDAYYNVNGPSVGRSGVDAKYEEVQQQIGSGGFIHNADGTWTMTRLYKPGAVRAAVSSYHGGGMDAFATSVIAIGPTFIDSSGRVTLLSTINGYNGSYSSKDALVRLYSGSSLVKSIQYSSDTSNASFAPGVSGTYDIYIRRKGTLWSRIPSTYVAPGTTLPPATLINGDIKGDNIIDDVDIDLVEASYMITSASSNWEVPDSVSGVSPSDCDLNGDGIVTSADEVIVDSNYGSIGQ